MDVNIVYFALVMSLLTNAVLAYVVIQGQRGVQMSIPMQALPYFIAALRWGASLTPSKADDELLGQLFPDEKFDTLKFSAEPLRYGTLVTREDLEAFGNQLLQRNREAIPQPERTQQHTPENMPSTTTGAFPAQETATTFQPGDKGILG